MTRRDNARAPLAGMQPCFSSSTVQSKTSEPVVEPIASRVMTTRGPISHFR